MVRQNNDKINCISYLGYILRDCIVFRKSIILLLAPFILLPLPLSMGTLQAKCAYVVLLMAVYWVTEALPLAVTAFLPVILFPILGVATVYQTSTNYLKDTNFILVGSLIIAVAVEDSNLHKRIALRLLLWVGSEPRNLMFGFMLSTAVLSAFMSNTATASMMLPIAVAVLEELIKHQLDTTTMTGTLISATSNNTAKPNGTASEKESLVGTPKMHPKIKFEMSGRRQSSPRRQSSLITAMDPEHSACLEIDYENGGQPVVRMGFRPIQSSTYLLGTDWHRRVDAWTQSEDIDIFPSPVPVSPQPTVVDPIAAGRRRQRSMSAAEEYRSKIPHFHTLPIRLQNISKAVLLCIAYGANLGGTATLTGTGPNLVFIGQLLKFYPNETAVTYVTWLAFGVPTMVFCCILGWCWLVTLFLGWRHVLPSFLRKANGNGVSANVNSILEEKYAELGKITFAEASVAFWFLVLVVLWIFREPMFIDGWNDWLGLTPGYTSDACAAMLIACILFVWPREIPDFICWRKNPADRPKSRRALMSWSTMKKFPWGLVLLLGGGFAMADGVRRSGLSDWLGCTLKEAFRNLPLMLILLIFILIIAFCTEIASNAATASIFVPVVLSVAESLEVNPLYFGLPITVATSFVFVLPVGTPPNAIIYESRMITALDMLKAGLVMNVLCTCVNLLNVNSWTYWFFSLDTYPTWAHSTNISRPCI